jgi:hypothetical protein
MATTMLLRGVPERRSATQSEISPCFSFGRFSTFRRFCLVIATNVRDRKRQLQLRGVLPSTTAGSRRRLIAQAARLTRVNGAPATLPTGLRPTPERAPSTPGSGRQGSRQACGRYQTGLVQRGETHRKARVTRPLRAIFWETKIGSFCFEQTQKTTDAVLSSKDHHCLDVAARRV